MSVFSKISKNSGAVLPASARNQRRKRLGLMLCKGKKDGNSNGCMKAVIGKSRYFIPTDFTD